MLVPFDKPVARYAYSKVDPSERSHYLTIIAINCDSACGMYMHCALAPQ